MWFTDDDLDEFDDDDDEDLRALLAEEVVPADKATVAVVRLASLVGLRDAVLAEIDERAREALSEGATMSRVGEAMGITKQAVSKRYSS